MVNCHGVYLVANMLRFPDSIHSPLELRQYAGAKPSLEPIQTATPWEPKKQALVKYGPHFIIFLCMENYLTLSSVIYHEKCRGGIDLKGNWHDFLLYF